MKHLIDIINEGNIDRCERKYREFVGMLKAYAPDVDVKDICVHKTSKNNWAVYTKDIEGNCKKLFIASFKVLDDDVIGSKGIEVCTESLNEAKSAIHKTGSDLLFEVAFVQYDPDTLAEYEDGDVDEDELHDSIFEADYDRVPLKANDDKKAIREAEPIIKKMVNKHPELCGGIVYDKRGVAIENIFV